MEDGVGNNVYNGWDVGVYYCDDAVVEMEGRKQFASKPFVEVILRKGIPDPYHLPQRETVSL